MAYSRTIWVNDSVPAINAENLNKIENQLEQNTNDIANIIESGSNDNGSWIKYSDGTMICYGLMPVTMALNIPTGSGFYGADSPNKYYAQTFIETPRVFIDNNNANWALVLYIEKDKEKIIRINLASFTAYDGEATFNIDYMAIGRWK